MKKFIHPSREKWSDLSIRPGFEGRALEKTVRSILEDVQSNGLPSVLDYAERFDGFRPDPIDIPIKDIQDSGKKIATSLKNAIDRAAINIEIFHRNQQTNFPVVFISRNIQCWQRDVPIERVGFYIPGGTAPLFSTVLMLGIPAKIAGCQEVFLCTPAGKDGKVHPAILYAASVCGIQQVYRIGGVQAIAAMTYGAGPLEPVDKIFGPGNQYVTMAKQLVSEEGVAIDMPAGPSEVLIIADEDANPEFAAADLLSQAEHGADSQVVLLCLSESFGTQVELALEKQLPLLPRAELARKALINSLLIVMESVDDMMDFSNYYAPEHLIILVKHARSLADKVKHAGSVFIGAYTPESAGDYASGTNHTLPTNGYARSYSGLSLQSFMKTIQFQEIQEEGLQELGRDIIEMADAEGLKAHSRAVEVRLNSKK